MNSLCDIIAPVLMLSIPIFLDIHEAYNSQAIPFLYQITVYNVLS